MPDHQFAWYLRALAAPEKIGTSELEIPSDAQCGYWRRKRSKAAREREPERPFEAVALFYGDDGRLWLGVDQKWRRPEGTLSVRDLANEAWPFFCREPVTKAAYDEYLATGRWADLPPPETKPAEVPVPASDRDVTRADNAPPEMTPLEEHLIAQEEDTVLIATFLAKQLASQEEVNKASEWANRCARRAKWLRDEHKRLKAPILEAGKKLDADYLRPAEREDDLAKRLTAAQAPFLRAEEQRRRDEAARANAAAVKEAEAKQEPPPPPIEPPKRASAGGATGRKSTLRDVHKATVVNYVALATFLATGGDAKAEPATCANTKLKELLDKTANDLAQPLADGVEQHGFKVRVEKEARR